MRPNDLARLLLVLEYHNESGTLREGLDRWCVDDWLTEEHAGDCRHQCFTCSRCMAELALERARALQAEEELDLDDMCIDKFIDAMDAARKRNKQAGAE